MPFERPDPEGAALLPQQEEEVYLLPSSFAQERLWFLDRFEPESPQFNIPAAFHLRGEMDEQALNRALSHLAERHETLRTTFTMEEGKLWQVVSPADPQPLQRIDASDLPRRRRRSALRRLARREASTPFDLARGPLFRATLVNLGGGEHALFLTLHHIIADGVSMRVLFDELEALYLAHRQGGEADLPDLPIQYADFADWQRRHLRGEVLEEKMAYWRQLLDGAPELLELPADHARPSLRSHAGAQELRHLPAELGRRVEALARRGSLTPFFVLLAAFQALLHHYTGSDDLVVGTAVANRQQAQLQGLIGFFVNTLPLRFDLAGDPTFGELMNRARETSLDAFAHQDVPFERLVEALAPGRNPSHTPLIQVMFLFEEQSAEAPLSLPGVEVVQVPVGTATAKYDVALAVSHRAGRLTLRADYNTDLYDATTIDRLLESYELLLDAASADPGRHLAELPVISPQQRQQILTEWNDTAPPPERRRRLAGRHLHHGFQEHAGTRPDAVAVATAGGELTYGELDRRANRLAHRLRAAGVGPGSLVGVHLGRTPRMVEAVLAVHKAGGAYVPLEVTWPERRVQWIIENRGLAVVLAEDATREHLAEVETALEVISLDDPARADSADSADDAEAPPADAASDPDDPAYIIFTSGSTGHPKGVVVRHRPAVNLVEWVNETFSVGPGDRLLFVTSLAFDLSVYDVFGTLAAGATIRLADADEVLDPQRLVRILRDEAVTFWDSAPASLQRCVPYLSQVNEAAGSGDDLRLVFLSGDWIPMSLPADLGEAFPGAQVVSLGGATEATIWSNFFPIGEIDPEWSSIPYGRPITGARYHVLDPRLAPCPVGVPGDLFIGGEVLSTGYAGAARQTAPAYVPDPFAAAAGGQPGARLYRTGDRARYFPDGNLEFLGRLDTQVKVRGYRIELGEIEAVLCEHPQTRQVVVLAREDTPGNQRLVAYHEPRDPALPPPEDELRELAAAELPAYMLPADYVRIDKWPVSPTGKLDRKALPSPEDVAEARKDAERTLEEVSQRGQPSAGPAADGDDSGAAGSTVPTTRGQAERAIAALWARLLEVDEVDPHAGFFDQGGNSLLLARVHVELQELFERDIPMVTLFRRTTVAELAAELTPAGSGADEEATAVAVAEEEAAAPDTASGHVAVVGMAGRFPGAADLDELWELLSEGREGIRFFSDQELLDAGVDPSRLDDDHYVKGRGALADPELFDADFFGLSPRDAQILDPQQRLFLETAWHALEDAGQAPGSNGGSNGAAPRVGVFAGASDNDYRRELLDNPEVLAAVGRFQIVLGNQLDYVATRLAYKLDLTGPALTVQTACSTSLVAVHMAARSLADGDCDLAVAGGTSVQAREVSGYPFLDGGIDSPDGHTRAFDADAAGAVGGSGVGAVVLKRLDEALADGDPVRAVIRGSAVNNDGGAKMTFTAPSADGQAAVIRAAQRAAGVEPSTVGYVEAHGTATPMGDPIEIDGLKRAWGAAAGNGDGEGRCLIGTIKSNLGHLDAAAGVAGLIKTVLAIEHGEIPPSLHFKTPNPKLEIEGSPFRIAAERTPWGGNGAPRRAGVSSFGIGGTNAHVLLEEAPERPADAAGPPRPAQLLRLSARTPAALERAMENLAGHLRRNADTGRNGSYLADVAYTLDVGRHAFPHRAAVVARGPGEAAEGLTEGRPLRGTAAGDAPPVVFLFPGQGAQYPGMGGDLYAEEPVFRDAVDQCCDLLEPYLGFDLRTVLYPLDGEDDEAAARLESTEVAQPALVTCEYALSELLRSWGIEPAAVAGHSIGEYTAALVAGVFTLPDALALVAARGRLMAGLPAGDMLAVRRPAAEVESWLEDHPEVELATVNAPDSVVVSGPGEAVAAFATWIAEEFGDKDGKGDAEDAVEVTPLHTSHAFHSAMMDPILDPFRDEVAEAAPMAPRIPIVSNATGTWLRDEEATDPVYWARHLRGAVRFADNLETLLADTTGALPTPPALVEVGPGRALSTFARRHPRAGDVPAVARTLPHPKEDRGDLDLLLEAVGRLWVAGVGSDPKAFWEGSRRRVPLPGYPFQRRRFWIDGVEAAPAPEAADDDAGEAAKDALQGATEEAVAAAWEDLLGVAGVGRRDDFFELGGSSLAGIGLAARLERDHGVDLPGSFLLEAPTVAEQAGLIDTLAEGGEAPAASCRVRLQAGSPGRPPLFMVHQVGGHVFTFRTLGRELGDGQPLFGLRSRGLEAGEEPFPDIEAMAEHYLELLREEKPRGPVLLGGASMGGMVAWEMARRLVEAGEPPALLTLMDTPCGDQMPPKEANAEPVSFVLAETVGTASKPITPRELVAAIGLELPELRALPFDERWERALAALAALGSDARAGLDEADLDEATLRQARRRARVLGANVDALYAYQPQPLPVRLLYFRAAERREGDPPRPELPWIELARGGCETIITAGNHETMHEEPAVETMAMELRRRLDLAADGKFRQLWQRSGR